MKKVKQEKLPGTAEALRKRIESSRRTRKTISAMPEKLRDAAVAPAAKHGICPISRAVRVDYAALKVLMNGRVDVDVIAIANAFWNFATRQK